MGKNKKENKPVNKFKSQEVPHNPKSHQAKNEVSEVINSKKVLSFLFSREAIPIYSLVLLLFSLYLLVSSVSYLATWRSDDVWLESSSSFFASHGMDAANAGGTIGAYLAHRLVKRAFGIGVFAIIAFFILMALRGLQLTKISLWRPLLIVLVLTFYLSLLGGYFFMNQPVVGGILGTTISGWLVKLLGNFFAEVVILGLGGVILLAFFPELLKQLKQYIHSKRTPRPTEEQESVSPEEIPLDPFASENVEHNIDVEKEPSDKSLSVNIINDVDVINNEITSEQQDEDIQDNITTPVEFIVNNVKEQEKVSEEHVEEKLHVKPSLDISENFSNEIISTDSIHDEEKETSKKTIPLVVEEQPNDQIEFKEEAVDFQDLIEDPVATLKHYRYPSTDLLKYHSREGGGVTREELEANKNKIIETLRNYEIDIVKIKATIGPTVTMYEIVPAPGIRISKIRNLEDDIALSLSALGIRIIAPIPGKGTIGIEVPNQKREIVSLRSLLENEKFIQHTGELPFALGKTITNEPYIADLAKLPHLLIAGATGQGKSVGINSIICSLLYKKHPSQLKFIFIDPKKVELAPYNKLENHFLAKLPDETEAIITDVTKVVKTLTSLTKLMDWRYDLLKEAGVKNIVEYNQKYLQKRLNPQKGHHYMPYIVVVIDEFADLIMTAGKEVELPVARIAQLARAVGIHLIVATQRPSVDVITGKIKANFPARIAFRVSSKVDSRTILDYNGAEQLVGMGDMLYLYGSDFLRLQCAYVDTEEIDQIVNFIGDQVGYPMPFPLPEVEDEEQGGDMRDISNLDKLFADAARIVVTTQQGSTSLLQTKLNIGFARARRIIEQLEQAGIVGPPQGSKPRDVLIKDLNHLEQFLSNLN